MTNMKLAITNTISITDLARNVSKAFDSIKDGVKVVVKNNKPEGVIMSPEEYVEMIDKIEDLEDSLLTLERLNNNKNKETISSKDFWKQFNITKEDIEDIDVEFE